MDEADQSDKFIDAEIASGINRATNAIEKPKTLPYIGVCHWCESPVDQGRIFCSKECCDDHSHDAKRRLECGL